MRQIWLPVKRFALSTVPQYWLHISHSRPALKFARFYLACTIIFGLHGVLSLILYFQMLDSSSHSPYFDFRATAWGDTHLGTAYGCSVQPTFPFAFWGNFSGSVANYVLLAWLVFAAGIFALSMATASFVLFFAFKHFGSIPRSRFASPRFVDKLFGRVCKWFPGALHFCSICTAVFIATPLVLVLFFNICVCTDLAPRLNDILIFLLLFIRVTEQNSKIVEISRPLARIKNCRSWVEDCVGDHGRYGRHLDCSLRENYMGFPAEPCEQGRAEPCVFPRTYAGAAQLSNTPGLDLSKSGLFAMSLDGNICEGEHIPDKEGGPVPWCPLCTDARRDYKTKVYDKSIGNDGRRRSRHETSGVVTAHRQRRSLPHRFQRFKSDNLNRGNSYETKETIPSRDLRDSEEEVFVQIDKKSEILLSNEPNKDKQLERQRKSQRRRKRLNIDEKYAAAEKTGIPWELSSTPADAFYIAYVRTMTYFKEGSYAVRIINIWSLCSICILATYGLAMRVFNQVLSPDGYFLIPSSAAFASTRWYIEYIFIKFMGIITCGKWNTKKDV